ETAHPPLARPACWKSRQTLLFQTQRVPRRGLGTMIPTADRRQTASVLRSAPSESGPSAWVRVRRNLPSIPIAARTRLTRPRAGDLRKRLIVGLAVELMF